MTWAPEANQDSTFLKTPKKASGMAESDMLYPNSVDLAQKKANDLRLA